MKLKRFRYSELINLYAIFFSFGFKMYIRQILIN